MSMSLGWTYSEKSCQICQKHLPIPRPSKQLYHIGECKRQAIFEEKRRHYHKYRKRYLFKLRLHYQQNKRWWKKYNSQYREKNAFKVKQWAKRASIKRQKLWEKLSEKQKEVFRNYQREYGQRIKIEVFDHYDKGKCRCCGEKKIEFLSIDHIHGRGRKHRNEIDRRGQRFYGWLRKSKYPSGYRVLCHNCNQAIGFFGTCPHKNKRTIC